jgi:hypothetical protein
LCWVSEDDEDLENRRKTASVIEHLPSILKALGSILSTGEREGERK